MYNDDIGRYVVETAHRIKVKLDFIFDDKELNGLQARILGYVDMMDKKGEPVYQKDIEREFKIRRSSVTSVLNTMEKNRFINRTSVFNDARLKKLVLTEKAKAIADDHREKVEWFEGMLKKGFTDEEISTLFTLLDKLLENLDETEVNNK